MHSASRVLLKPASPGTGVIAGGGVRAVLELAGIHDVLSKSLGSQNPINLVKATVAALQSLRSPDEVAELRGLTVREVLGLEERAPAEEPVSGGARRGAARRRGDACLMATLTITQVKSSAGASRKQHETLKTLGLGKIGAHRRAGGPPDRSRPGPRRRPPGEGRWLTERIGLHSLKPAPGLAQAAQARRPRRGLGHGQDLRPRPQGRGLALGRASRR